MMPGSAPRLRRKQGRLSILAAAMVIARRDFTAILFSRSFIFFLLGPLFPLFVGAMAGSIGEKVEKATSEPQLGLLMSARDTDAMLAAHAALAPHLSGSLPDLVIVRQLAPGETAEPAEALKELKEEAPKQGARKAGEAQVGNLAAIVSGTPAHPVLTGAPDRLDEWQGPVSLLASRALAQGPVAIPDVKLDAIAAVAASADRAHGRVVTAQAGQTLLFLLTMLLAGMVLSNLVEEKGNKIIEVLAAAIPMDAVFLGKLFAMLAVSLVGITVWAVTGGLIHWIGGDALPALTSPAVGWPLFLVLGVAYFAMGYLILGSLFLAIGSMATTVREVQTLSMPVTMLQLMVFFFASYAMANPGSPVELAAVVVPFSSPFAMLARAAIAPSVWPHALALAWQAICVALFVRAGAAMFRRRVMKSGVAGGHAKKRRLIDLLKARP